MIAYTRFTPIVLNTALMFGLRVDIIAAQIEVESRGNPWAYKPEPPYLYLWDVHRQQPFRRLTDAERRNEVPPLDFTALTKNPTQEWWAQQASWGLMQVMGAVAREHGFTGEYLTELTDPMTNLHYGAKHLRWCLNREHDDYRKALSRYNGGGTHNAVTLAYAAAVFTVADTQKDERHA